MKQRPDPLNPRAVLEPAKAWPGNARARGKTRATANLDGPCARRTSEPAGRDEGTAARHEQRNSANPETIDDVITNLTRRVLREDETTMEDGSSRRVRTLVTQMARRDLSGNKIACALISMMARSTCSNRRPNTLTQDPCQPASTKASCTARPDHTHGSN